MSYESKPEFKLPKEYAKLKESDFPHTINGIEYKTKHELADRYSSDLMELANLIYKIWSEDKRKKVKTNGE